MYLRTTLSGEIPSFKLVETEYSYSFLDIGPLSKGHALIIPKCMVFKLASRCLFVCKIILTLTIVQDHAEKMHQLPDEYLTDALPIAKKIALALGCENYNILQVIRLLADPHHDL